MFFLFVRVFFHVYSNSYRIYSVSQQWRHSVASDLGLHYFPFSHKNNTRPVRGTD